MKTVVGPLFDRDGLARSRAYVENEHGAWETRSRHWATPTSEVRRTQAAHIPVDLEHNPSLVVGKVEHLELDEHDRLWAVATIDDKFDPPDHLPLYWSASFTCNEHDHGDVEITSLAITPHPAQLGLLPLKILDGDVSFRGATRQWNRSQLDGYRRDLCERACARHVLERGQPLLVRHAHHDEHPGPTSGSGVTAAERLIAMTLHHDLQLEQHDEAWQHRPLRHRPAGPIISVR